jgi:hypothetical protein
VNFSASDHSFYRGILPKKHFSSKDYIDKNNEAIMRLCERENCNVQSEKFIDKMHYAYSRNKGV